MTPTQPPSYRHPLEHAIFLLNITLNMDTIMDDIIPSAEHEDEEYSVPVESWLRRSARWALTTAVDDLQPLIEDLIVKTVDYPDDDDPERVERWVDLNYDIRVALREHLRSRVYSHIDHLAEETGFQDDPDATEEVGDWNLELNVEEKEMVGSVMSFEAKLVRQDDSQFEAMVGISSIVTVTPDLKTISVQSADLSSIETADPAYRVSYDGPRRPGLRDDREGSSETVFVEDAGLRIEECNKVILDDIKTLVTQAGDDIRPTLESDLEGLTERLDDMKELLVGFMEHEAELQPALTIDLSQWNLSLETYIPQTTEVDDPQVSRRDPLVGSTAYFEAMTKGRKRFQLCSSGGLVLDRVFPMEIDYLPSEELVDRWESLQRSRG